MANTKSAKKRARQTPKRTERNNKIRSRVKTAVRSAREMIESKSAELPNVLKTAIAEISKAASKGTIHKRNASRRISRLMKHANKALHGGTAVATAPVAAKAKATKAKSKATAAKKAAAK